MLVLSRKVSEVIRIGDQVTITVIRIGPNTVRIGIDAPADLPVYRQEVYERVQREEANHNDSAT